MLRFPGGLTATRFLAEHWQKRLRFLPGAATGDLPTITADELGWLATLDDVESRIVFTESDGEKRRYRVESGPFDDDELRRLPGTDWTLLVHDVEKHLPEMRPIFDLIPFVPDWRIDDLMVSFAAPGGGVGPHCDQYDVFLVQGVGTREWRLSDDDIAGDPTASADLALLREFEGDRLRAETGDVLYLPPGVAHWGTALTNCTTYSIGMRAPQYTDLAEGLPDIDAANPFYRDPDLDSTEAVKPGYITNLAAKRAAELIGCRSDEQAATALGRAATETKQWLTPKGATHEEAEALLAALGAGTPLTVHGMARLAFDDRNAYVNGHCRALPSNSGALFEELCSRRKLSRTHLVIAGETIDLLRWMLRQGAFETPETA